MLRYSEASGWNKYHGQILRLLRMTMLAELVRVGL
jgi:hypothetical protein